MKKPTVLSVSLVAVFLMMLAFFAVSCQGQNAAQVGSTINLPSPVFESRMTVEQAIQARRSVRSFAEQPVTLQQVSNILWSAQGITDAATGHRAAPSAMAVYPLEVYLVAANVTGLPAGVYRYVPNGHKLALVVSGDQRANVSGQVAVKQAPASLIFSYSNDKVKRFGPLAERFAALEIGHAAENVCLEVQALGLATVTVGGVDSAQVTKALGLKDETPIYILPVGKKK